LGALTVTLATSALVVLDVADGSVHRYWSRHSFSSSVLAGLLVLLLTALVVDRVARMRQVKSQSRAVAAQAAVIVGQGTRAVDLVAHAADEAGDSDKALDEVQNYTLMLLISTPVLIDTKVRTAFLEAAQRLAAELFRGLPNVGQTMPDAQTKTRLHEALERMRGAAGPLLQPLNIEQRAAVSSDHADSPQA
jgi:FlaA1/EpsC-like NDP-sugar epimerase